MAYSFGSSLNDYFGMPTQDQQTSEAMIEPKKPMWMKVLGDVSTSPLPVYVGNQAFKGSRTIRHGGWGPEGEKAKFTENFYPQSMTGFKNNDQFLHDNFIAKLFFNTEKQEAGRLGKRLEGKTWAKNRGLLDADGNARPLWNTGLLGRATASARTEASFTPAIGENTMAFLSKTAPDLAAHLGEGYIFRNGAEAGMAQMMSANGAITQKALGLMSSNKAMTPEMEAFGEASRPGFMAARAWGQEASTAMEGGLSGLWEKASMNVGERAVEKTVLKEGVSATVEKVGTGMVAQEASGLLAKWGVTTADNAVPVVGQVADVAMAVYTAYSIAKTGAMLTKDLVINPLAHAAESMFNSAKGGIDNSPFGRGYTDTEAASTSRARGVAAIQNSRLNARSVLGSEAGMMHAHYG